MSEVSISVDELSKRYRIGRAEEKAESLGVAIGRSMLRPIANLKRLRRLAKFEGGEENSEDIIWALKDVSFEVNRGEVVGIIGRNGAGKTTLLKLLSRITEPTSGRALVKGRVASLLEVGTGFHPELTGRDNVYLNGSILGMRRAEIDRKFDEIVEFSGVERFIDTPVKRYSTGMSVRLAFAVAAHLEPEILLVDEVLAVGDVEFQQRCLGRMREVTHEEGRTVLFVSHNMPAIKSLCKRAILIDEGEVKSDGEVATVVASYLRGQGQIKGDGVVPENAPRRTGTREALVRRVVLENGEGGAIDEIFLGQNIRVNVYVDVKSPIDDAAVEIGISTPDGLRVATATSLDGGGSVLSFGPGMWKVSSEMKVSLLPGRYALDVSVHHWMRSKLTIDWVDQALMFSALDVSEAGMDQYIRFSTRYQLNNVRGFIRPEAVWSAPVEAIE